MWSLATSADMFPRPAYAASNGAVANMMREMARAYAALGIQINALCPASFKPKPARKILLRPMPKRPWAAMAAHRRSWVQCFSLPHQRWIL